MDSSPAWTRYEEGDGERGKDLREGKKCRCQDFEKLPAFPFGPATALHHPRFVAISTHWIGDWCSIDPAFYNPSLFPSSRIRPLSLYHDELLFDEQVDQGIAISMPPISPANLLLEHHTFILPPKHGVFCAQ